MRLLARYIILSAVALLLAAPLISAVATSLKPLEDVFQTDAPFLPDPPRWENYGHALQRMPIARFALNSLLIATLAAAGTVLSTSMAGYAFARLRWPGRTLCFVLLLALLVIPSQIYLIPHYLIYKYLGWINTYKPLVVPSFLAVDAFYVFLFRQFFRSIPRALTDAALLDGATHWQVYRRIMLPVAKPVVVTVLAMNFIYHWQSFLGPLIYLNDFKKFPISLGLRMYQTMEGDWVNYLMAASLLSLIPVALLFLFAQRFITRGMVLSGLRR
ncbi:MAG: carbohydrate ABC transporter permease [Planctomycetes bacterium]|nr:carbohydrate ABC transporter permease [Planctomycetota bacterium]